MISLLLFFIIFHINILYIDLTYVFYSNVRINKILFTVYACKNINILCTVYTVYKLLHPIQYEHNSIKYTYINIFFF